MSVMDYLEKKYHVNSKFRLSSRAIIDIMDSNSGYNPYGYIDIRYSFYKLPYNFWVVSKTKKATKKDKLILKLKELKQFKEKDGFKMTQNFAHFEIDGLTNSEKEKYSFGFIIADVTTNLFYTFFESRKNLKIGSYNPCGGNFKLEKNHTYQVIIILHDAYDGSTTKLNPIEFTWQYD